LLATKLKTEQPTEKIEKGILRGSFKDCSVGEGRGGRGDYERDFRKKSREVKS
jgi:hypothetical protein